MNQPSNYFEIHTDRIQFRKLTLDDIPEWETFFNNNEFLPFLGIDLEKSAAHLAKEWIEMQLWHYENQSLGHLAATCRETKIFLGLGGILPRKINDIQEYEIAYSFFEQHRGKGYATELAQAMLSYGMETIQTSRFISIIHVDNFNSGRVAEKNGMKPEAFTEFNGMPVRIWEKKTYSKDND